MSIAAPAAWEEDEDADLPPLRPRRSLVNPLTMLLLALAVGAGGFLGGVLLEKSRSSASASTGGRNGFAALLAARGGAGAGAGGAGGGFGRFLGGGAGAAGATVGSVAAVSGGTLYVTDSQGNTVKVLTSPSASVTKSVSVGAKSIHPGDSVIVTGAKGADGSVLARSVRDQGAAGGGAPGSSPSTPSSGGGVASLFAGG